MSKVITLRLSENEYKRIFTTAQMERRPISNFITAVVMDKIEEEGYTDSIETAQIMADKRLLKKLEAGYADAKKHKVKLVG